MSGQRWEDALCGCKGLYGHLTIFKRCSLRSTKEETVKRINHLQKCTFQNSHKMSDIAFIRATYPKMTAFHTMILFSDGAPLTPAGGSSCSLTDEMDSYITDKENDSNSQLSKSLLLLPLRLVIRAGELSI